MPGFDDDDSSDDWSFGGSNDDDSSDDDWSFGG